MLKKSFIIVIIASLVLSCENKKPDLETLVLDEFIEFDITNGYELEQNYVFENVPTAIPPDFFINNKWVDFTEALEAFDMASRAFSGIFTNNSLRILLGDIDYLNYSLDIFSLARMDNQYLRLLRNMIYAKYGYIFNSPDLTSYFSAFDWYDPEYSNVDEFLTDLDEYNINMIQSFENRDESLPNIVWSNHVGVWQDLFVMAAGWSNRFVIHPNNQLEYYYSQMRDLPISFGLSGTYTINGNVLIYIVNQIYYHVTNVELSLGANYYNWEPYEQNTITLAKPIVYRFPVTDIETKDFFWASPLVPRSITRETITIGGKEFYKFFDDVDHKF